MLTLLFYSGGILSYGKSSGLLSKLAEKQLQVSIVKFVKCHWARGSQNFESQILSKRLEPLTKRYSVTFQNICIPDRYISDPLSELYLCIGHLIIKRAMLSESFTAAQRHVVKSASEPNAKADKIPITYFCHVIRNISMVNHLRIYRCNILQKSQ